MPGVPKTWKPLQTKYHAPTPVSPGPIMKSANRLGHQATRPLRMQASRAIRPDHAAFHQTRASLGAHRF